ncbi:MULTISPECIES: nickel ABC transporter permease subunit NikC [unclassified Paenibacillus]|uniref:nickel ABC transporter permease subunit NikC n=1 Tax=unclassified Paenibacillus TaxID=185978 RepID=UPI0003E237A5|nr:MULTISPECIES: nickel ABC transporter permease subunit NikC [unclassified Paenibacillus]ETT39580.1 nickel transport system permease [Paenibacillus sp. FSL R7-269]OMF87642.1 nickel ABC transporter permease subunit NikC [Paenibacillus sp. FSL R7-0337]
MNNLSSRFKGRRVIMICGSLLILFGLAGLLAPWISPHDPIRVNLAAKLSPPSWEYLLGTDQLGRDNLSRLLYGTRISLGFASLIFAASLGVGLLAGVVSGYIGGWLDAVLMRLCDGIMSFPSMILVFGLIGILGPGLSQLVIALMLVQWVYFARMFRNMIVSLKERNFITAARISGSSPWQIMSRHLIPNILPSIVVIGTLEMGWAIMDISAMSFLGLGVQAPTPEWGAMLNEGKSFIRNHPELMLYPGLMIIMVVASFNLLGEALSERYGIKRGS